ncbi:MAG: hypothetical protein RLZZ568_426, partial [Cyanobacteriota bacterium]
MMKTISPASALAVTARFEHPLKVLVMGDS